MVKIICSVCLVVFLLFWGSGAIAGTLADRLAQFPSWESKPHLTSLGPDELAYPHWIKGTWNVTSTLVDTIAPLAPDVVTPGFESNRRYLNEPFTFMVRFVEKSPVSPSQVMLPLPRQTLSKSSANVTVVADRAFNGLNIARAYLGANAVESVKVDPDSPLRQSIRLQGGTQLVSIVNGHASETPAGDRFIATEVSQQIFRVPNQLYVNVVETTTAYQRFQSPVTTIESDQVTAVYLSPQDPDYFKAMARPVALYRYHLKLVPTEQSNIKNNRK